MLQQTHYDILGVEPGTDEVEIKAAFRRLARRYHPDVSVEAGAEDKFKSISAAYDVLRDADKRGAYDRSLRNGGGAVVRPPDAGYAARNGFEGAYPSDDGTGTGIGFGDLLDGMFKRGRADGDGRAAQAARRDTNWIRQAVPLGIVHAGGSVVVESGRRRLVVAIPKGVGRGQEIQVGQGRRGELVLEIAYAEHPLFDADGRDLFHVLPLSQREADHGATIAVPTLGGPVDLDIPAGSKPGDRLRMPGLGLPLDASEGAAAGDMIVELDVLAPRTHDTDQREASVRRRLAMRLL